MNGIYCSPSINEYLLIGGILLFMYVVRTVKQGCDLRRDIKKFIEYIKN